MEKGDTSGKERLLGKLEPVLLAAAVTFYEKPLYQYANDRKEIHVLFVGPCQELTTGASTSTPEMMMLDSFLQMSLICGQVLNHTLHLHVMDEYADSWKARLLEKAPALTRFVRVDESGPEHAASSITFEAVKSIGSARGTKAVLAHLEACRYVILCCPDREAALLRGVCDTLRTPKAPYLMIHCQRKSRPSGCSPKLKFQSVEDCLRKNKTVDRLGEMAFRQYYQYARAAVDDPDLARQRKAFADSAFDQRANLASVVHLKYKLFSLGINPNARPHTIAAQYGAVLADPEKVNLLSNLEHTRWMMEKLSDGYRPPESEEALMKYGFTDENPKKWHINTNTVRMHNCLVPRRLERTLNAWKHSEWDRWNGLPYPEAMQEINALPELDPLDKMSLKVHRLALEKLNQRRKDVDQRFAALKDRLKACGYVPLDKHDPVENYGVWLSRVFLGQKLHQEGPKADMLREACMQSTLPEKEPDALLRAVHLAIPVITEYYRYKCYKAMDDEVLWLLPKQYLWPSHMTVLKLASPQAAHLIASVLLLEPQKVVYFGVEAKQVETIRSFLARRGGFAAVERVDPDPKQTLRELEKQIRQESRAGLCVVDITGADPALSFLIQNIVRKYKNTAVITCDSERQKIENLYQFPLAACVQPNAKLTVEEVFSLLGAKKQEKDEEYTAMIAGNQMDDLWDVFLALTNGAEGIPAKSLAGVSSMLALAVNQSKGRYPCFILEKDRNGTEFVNQAVNNASLSLFRNLELESLLRQLEGYGLIQALRITADEAMGTVSLSYSILNTANRYFLSFLDPNARRAFYKPLVCQIDDNHTLYLHCKDKEDQALYVNAALSLADDQVLTKDKSYPKDMLVNALNLLKDKGLIYGLTTRDMSGRAPDGTLACKLELKFFFANKAVKQMLLKTGDFLEAKVWSIASDLEQTFDDVRSSIQFWWDDTEQTDNELDVLMTKGLQLYVVSCKLPLPNKDHLYEVDSVASRFSLNSRRAMVYAYRPEKAAQKEDATSAVWIRAQDMGIGIVNILDEDQSVEAMLRNLAEQR